MSDIHPAPAGDHAEWDGGWERNREAQERACLAATPAQRLAWLEEAIDFARKTILSARKHPLPDGDR